jgi:anti-sigma factor (TIGR02949 family)
MTCEEAFAFLAAYLDQELDGDTRATFEEHLALCPPCIDYLDTYKATIRLGKDACAEDAPQEIPEALVQAILAARGK